MKLRKIFATATMALFVGATAMAQAPTVDDVRIYINPGHGAFDSGSRPMGTVKHGANKAYDDINNDTANFFESNTNLQKGLALLEKLVSFGVPFDRTKNQTNDNPHRVGAALDLTQNIVMSRVKSGAYPAYIDYSNHVYNPESDYYDRSLSEISAEVEFNDFDLFISIHSNANVDGDNINFPLFLYRGTDAEEGNPGSIAVSKACWPYLYATGHQQWSAYKTSTNVRGDHNFYSSTSTVKYPVTDPDYVFDENNKYATFIPSADGTTPDTVAYTGYLGVIKHGVPGFLAEGYFHTYQPARHRYMNWDVCHLEGVAYARGVADYYGWDKKETLGTIYGIVRDMHEKFSHQYYNANPSTNDKFMPLNGVNVVLKKEGIEVATYTTDDEWNGAFIFHVEPGTYTIECFLEGYKPENYSETSATAEPGFVTVTVETGKNVCPEIFLENVDYVPPTKVYENYPDSTAGKTGFNLFPSYEIKAANTELLTEQLADKKVRRQIVRDNKLYVLALDAANEPYIYLADLVAGTVTELDKAAVVMGGNGILKISDIALTADHVLVASGFSLNHYDDSYAETDGTERGSVHFYKWSQNIETGLPETCELWFTTNYCCNFFRGKLGKTIAYSGTLEEGTITTTCPHGTHTSDIAMRFAQFSIVEGQNTGVIRYDAWIAAPNETNFYGDALSDSDEYELMISPLGKNNFILDGNLINPFEWNAEGEGSEPQVLGRNEKLNVKSNGANYFRYAGKTLMVATDINEEGKVAGIKLFDITNGLTDAVEIALSGATIEPMEYTYASAHGELALELSSDDKTIGADIELYLVVDGKVVKFTETENFTTVTPAEGTANPYAYALSSEVVDDKLKVNYALNADATTVTVKVIDAEGTVVATAEGATAKAAHSVEIALADLNNGTYTWEVEVAGAEKAAVETFKSYMFYHPRGVDVDNNMESPAFGHIYVTEGMNSSSSQYWACDGNGGLGLYIFDPQMNGVKNPTTGLYSFRGGWTLNYKAGSASAADFARVRVAEDGRIFVTRMQDDGDYILVAENHETLVATDKMKSLFEGLTFDATTYKYTNAEGTFMGASNLGFDVKGAGEDLKLLALSSSNNHWSYVFSGGSTDEYALGTADVLPVPTSIEALTGKYTIAPSTTNVDYDDRGGIWYCQYRGTPTDAQPALIYLDENGEIKYFEGDGGASRGGGGVRVSPDGKQIAIASSSANPKQFTVYNLVWSENGVPGLRRQYVITHEIGTNVYDIAWDIAGNIYICGNSGEYLKAFALPRTEAVTTKAASKYAFEIGSVAIEEIGADANVPVEYYNLQGVKVANPEKGIFIKKQGNKATKVVL